MTLNEKKKLAQLSRRLKAAQARYMSLEKRAEAIEDKRVGLQDKANGILNLLYSRKGERATATRKKSLETAFIKANREAERLKKIEDRVFEQLTESEEKIAALTDNMKRTKKKPRKNPSATQTLKKAGSAAKKALRSTLEAGSKLLASGAKALKNPRKRLKVRNSYIDLVIRGTAKKTPQGWKIGKKTVAQGKGTAKLSSGYYLDKATGAVYAKRQRNKTTKKRSNPSAESIRKKFAGSVTGERDLFYPVGTPNEKLAKLGKLVSIKTEKGTIKPIAGEAWLVADSRGKLHIGSTTHKPLIDGPKRCFGKVSQVEYQDVKRHLGISKQTIFWHRVGEENGIKPTLHADGKGGLIFRGGDYRLTSRGLEN